MRIAVMEPLGVEQEKFMQIAREAVGDDVEIVCYDTRTTDVEELGRRGRDADIIAIGNLPFPREVLEKCENVKMLAVAFTGLDHVDLKYCEERGIKVQNCAGYATTAVAELTFGLLLDLCRNIGKCDTAARNGGTKAGLIGFELEGRTMGIVGTGAIGARVAKLAAAFGMDVIAYSRTPGKVAGVRYVSLEELLAQADVVSLHVPLTDETRGMIGAEELALMKKTAVLVNTARGPVVDTKALADALNSGRIAGAAIDVFDAEPPLDADEPLINAKNTVVTPHVAFATDESMIKRAEIEFRNIAEFIKDKC
ncbi:MAG: NAD(P)-dependent oxidoreductase [Eubacteriales bacterium]|nr:NAD(P)-dependent oxidoreductase [Eubacteriales bacterium]